MQFELAGKRTYIFSDSGELANALAKDFSEQGSMVDVEPTVRAKDIGSMTETPDVIVTRDFAGMREALNAVRSGGSIVNLSTAIGHSPSREKTEREMLRKFAVEGAKRNLRVNGVALGVIDTEVGHDVLELAGERILGTIILKRFGRPQEVANTVLFLAGSPAAYITGEMIRVDGGVGG